MKLALHILHHIRVVNFHIKFNLFHKTHQFKLRRFIADDGTRSVAMRTRAGNQSVNYEAENVINFPENHPLINYSSAATLSDL
jgi:hypothetical protein